MKKKWVWIIVVTGLFFILSIVGTFIVVFSKLSVPPVKAVEAQLTYLKQGNFDTAYGLFSNLGKKNMSLDQFKKFVSTNSTLLDFKTDFFSNERVQNDQATINGTVTGEDGTKLPVEYRLINENGSWKILSIVVNPSI